MATSVALLSKERLTSPLSDKMPVSSWQMLSPLNQIEVTLGPKCKCIKLFETSFSALSLHPGGVNGDH
jgi:hypothetical protein